MPDPNGKRIKLAENLESTVQEMTTATPAPLTKRVCAIVRAVSQAQLIVLSSPAVLDLFLLAATT